MISLTFRQTNIIWVTVFMALAVIDIVSLDDPLLDTVQSLGKLGLRNREDIKLIIHHFRDVNGCRQTIGDQDMSSFTRNCETIILLLPGVIWIHGISYLEPRNCTRRSCKSCGWLAFPSTLLLFVLSFILCSTLDLDRWCHQDIHVSKLGKVTLEGLVSGCELQGLWD